MANPTMKIANELGDWLQIRFGEPIHPDDPTDPGWISTPIEADLAGLFRAQVFALLLVDEITDFRRQLESAWAAGSGVATLSSAERWIELRVSLTEDEAEVTGELGAPRTPNVRLAFEIPEVPREQVQTMLSELVEAEQHVSASGLPAEPPDPPRVGDING